MRVERTIPVVYRRGDPPLRFALAVAQRVDPGRRSDPRRIRAHPVFAGDRCYDRPLSRAGRRGRRPLR